MSVLGRLLALDEGYPSRVGVPAVRLAAPSAFERGPLLAPRVIVGRNRVTEGDEVLAASQAGEGRVPRPRLVVGHTAPYDAIGVPVGPLAH
jgi:hypothetical protein